MSRVEHRGSRAANLAAEGPRNAPNPPAVLSQLRWTRKGALIARLEQIKEASRSLLQCRDGRSESMTTKDLIHAEIDRIDDEDLDECYKNW